MTTKTETIEFSDNTVYVFGAMLHNGELCVVGKEGEKYIFNFNLDSSDVLELYDWLTEKLFADEG